MRAHWFSYTGKTDPKVFDKYHILVVVFFVEKVCPRTCVVYAGDVWFVEYEPEKIIDELEKDFQS